MKSKKNSNADLILFYALTTIAAFMLLSAFYPGFGTAVKSPLIIAFFSMFFFSSAVLHAWRNFGKRFAMVFFIVMILYSMSAEYSGTHFGIYYNHENKPLLFEGNTYYYADFMPMHIFKVPVPLILMWPFIIYCSFYIGSLLSQMIFERKNKRNKKFKKFILPSSILIASIIAMLWDVSFDPLATKLGFWTWVGGGSAFKWINGGIPIGNFTSWFLITMFSLLIFAGIMMMLGEEKNNISMRKDRNGTLLSLFLFLFIWTFAIAQKEYLFLLIGIVTQLVPWAIVASQKKSRVSE